MQMQLRGNNLRVSEEEIDFALSVLREHPSVSQDTVNAIRNIWQVFGKHRTIAHRSALDTLANVASEGGHVSSRSTDLKSMNLWGSAKAVDSSGLSQGVCKSQTSALHRASNDTGQGFLENSRAFHALWDQDMHFTMHALPSIATREMCLPYPLPRTFATGRHTHTIPPAAARQLPPLSNELLPCWTTSAWQPLSNFATATAPARAARSRTPSPRRRPDPRYRGSPACEWVLRVVMPAAAASSST